MDSLAVPSQGLDGVMTGYGRLHISAEVENVISLPQCRCFCISSGLLLPVLFKQKALALR
jgi:hypothetical protein